MIDLFWRLVAKLLARPAIAALVIARTPYLHIRSDDGLEVYIGRWWLFTGTQLARICWIPWSIRVHHIMRADADRDLHDHPWDALTVILHGWYTEQRLLEHDDPVLRGLNVPASALATEYIDRRPGNTAQRKHGEYHRIDEVSAGGVYTLFITNRWKGDWGFLVNVVKIKWQIYTASFYEK